MGIDSASFISPNPWALRVVEDTLHLLGAYVYVFNGDTIRSWSTYDGTTWRQGDPGQVFSQTSAVAKYQGELYVGGNFTIAGGIKDIARRTPNGWQAVGPGLFGDPWVNDLMVFDDLLWVTGEFYQSAGNAASGIMAWDGTQWLNPFPQLQAMSQGRFMQVRDGALYFTMQMAVQGLAGEYMLARYDGQQLCVIGGPDIFVSHIAVSSDTLYAQTCTLLNCLNGPQVNGIVKLPLSVAPDACFDVEVGIMEGNNSGHVDLLHVVPNPAGESAWIHLDPRSAASVQSVRAFDGLGQEVWQVNSAGLRRLFLPTGAWAEGCYHLCALDAQGSVLGRAKVLVVR